MSAKPSPICIYNNYYSLSPQTILHNIPITCSTIPASDPVCQYSRTSATSPDGDIVLDPGVDSNITMSCSVTFRGNLIPRMEWRKQGGSLIELVSTEVVPNQIVTSYLHLQTPPSMEGPTWFTPMWYTCQVSFDQPSLSGSDDMVDHADNAPEYNFTWKSPIIRISSENFRHSNIN